MYDAVYEDAEFQKPVLIQDLIQGSRQDERLVVVGDALMHPGELLSPYGHIQWNVRNPKTGASHLKELAGFFRHSAWLNPEPRRFWQQTTIELVAEIFPMFVLTLEGITQAVNQLIRSSRQA